jgi:hypothetical protein
MGITIPFVCLVCALCVPCDLDFLSKINSVCLCVPVCLLAAKRLTAVVSDWVGTPSFPSLLLLFSTYKGTQRHTGVEVLVPKRKKLCALATHKAHKGTHAQDGYNRFAQGRNHVR